MAMAWTRRSLVAGAGALVASGGIGVAASADDEPFSWEWLQALAGERAVQPFRPPPPEPAGIGAVTYDALNHLTFRPDAALWRGSPNPVRFFPLSVGAAAPVRIFAVAAGRAREIVFSRAMFDGADALPPGVDGFSGFRVMDADEKSDWLAFRSASYFRASGALDQYGLSARALAIDTGLSRPEEFPTFTHFWLERAPDGVTVYALLESPSATGAWRFRNRKTTAGVTQDVSATVILRADVERLGLAPLTSMFWYGEGTPRYKAIDWRPEIHDSDGLAMLTGRGERIWRPLVNPPHPHLSSFLDDNPKRFALLQRDRAFDHYQDDGVFYGKRPNLWVEPGGNWGAGAVTLFELPTDVETSDNIAAFWTPATPARKGTRTTLDYRLIWNASEPDSPLARCVDNWQGVAGRPGGAPLPQAIRLTADFSGPSLAGLTNASGVEPVVSLSRGDPISVHAYQVAGQTMRWRLMMDVPSDGAARTLRAYLRHRDEALTETLICELF